MCNNCKYAKEITGCYCMCRKKNNRVRISGMTECKKFEEKADGTENSQ